MAKLKKVEVPVVEEPIIVGTPPIVTKTEKELLTECYEFMQSRGITSISHIENLIANFR